MTPEDAQTFTAGQVPQPQDEPVLPAMTCHNRTPVRCNDHRSRTVLLGGESHRPGITQAQATAMNGQLLHDGRDLWISLIAWQRSGRLQRLVTLRIAAASQLVLGLLKKPLKLALPLQMGGAGCDAA